MKNKSENGSLRVKYKYYMNNECDEWGSESVAVNDLDF